MDSIRVSEAPDPGSIPGEATKTSAAVNQQIFGILIFTAYMAFVRLMKEKIFIFFFRCFKENLF